jgi:SAM-dependent methyltransferase/DNA-binding CsgD family transcriptional regulator
MTSEQLDATLRAFQESRILLTAVELDVFTAIGDGATAQQSAERLGADPRALTALLNALVSIGLLEKTEGTYRNTPLAAERLVSGSPGNDRPGMLHDAHRWHTWSRLTDLIRGTAQPEEHRSLDTERHRALLAMLNRKARERAPHLVRMIGCQAVRRVLDIGGGSAAYSIAFVRTAPDIIADVFELPEVLPITREYIDAAGESDRVHVRPGDLLTDELLPGGGRPPYDLALLFSITHIISAGENQSLFARCHRALAPGGRLAIHDHVLNDDKTAPRAGAIFAINMLVATRSGGTYSMTEYDSWLRAAGFRSVERLPMPGAPTSLLIATA